MKTLTVLLALLILESTAQSSWTKSDIALEASFVTLQVIDWGQTSQARKARYKELNPAMGDRPSVDTVNYYFLGTTIAHVTIAHFLKKPYRTYWQMIWIGVEVNSTRINGVNGFGVNLHF